MLFTARILTRFQTFFWLFPCNCVWKFYLLPRWDSEIFLSTNNEASVSKLSAVVLYLFPVPPWLNEQYVLVLSAAGIQNKHVLLRLSSFLDVTSSLLDPTLCHSIRIRIGMPTNRKRSIKTGPCVLSWDLPCTGTFAYLIWDVGKQLVLGRSGLLNVISKIRRVECIGRVCV